MEKKQKPKKLISKANKKVKGVNQSHKILQKTQKRAKRLQSLLITTLSFLLTKSSFQFQEVNATAITKHTSISNDLYAFTSVAFGSTIFLANLNRIFWFSATIPPYSYQNRTLDTNDARSLHICRAGPYILAADLEGRIFILDPSNNAATLREIKLPSGYAKGRGKLYRYHIYAFENTNYYFLQSNDQHYSGAAFGDWTSLKSPYMRLRMNLQRTVFSSLESPRMIIGISETLTNVVKVDATVNGGRVLSYDNFGRTILAMISIGKVGLYENSTHLFISQEAKIGLYDSKDDTLPRLRNFDSLGGVTDLAVVPGTFYAAASTTRDEIFVLVDLENFIFENVYYGNENDTVVNNNDLESFAVLENSNLMFLAMKRQFEIWKINSPICHKSCGFCSSGALPTSCQSCREDFYAINSLGVCSKTRDCRTQDKPLFKIDTETCEESCPNKYYKTGRGLCLPCVANCLSCSNSLECNTCVAPYEVDRTTGACTLKCKEGQFYNKETEECQRCHSSCLYCSGRGDKQCTMCYGVKPPSRDNTCSYGCAFNEFWDKDQMRCSYCHSACNGCDGPSSEECVKCRSGYEEIRTDSSGLKTCKSKCPSGYFRNPTTLICRYCTFNCKECSGQSSCKECYSPYYLNDNYCVSRCLQPRMKTRNEEGILECKECTPNCMVCLTSVICEECQIGYLLSTDAKTCTKKVIDDDNGQITRTQNDATGAYVFLFSLFIILVILLVLYVVLNGNEKADDEEEENNSQEAAGRRNRGENQSGRNQSQRQQQQTQEQSQRPRTPHRQMVGLYRISQGDEPSAMGNEHEPRPPMGRPFYPVYADGEENPLKPVASTAEQALNRKVHVSLPFHGGHPRNTLYQRTFLEINIKNRKKKEPDSIFMENREKTNKRLGLDVQGNLVKMVPPVLRMRKRNPLRVTTKTVPTNVDDPTWVKPYLPPMKVLMELQKQDVKVSEKAESRLKKSGVGHDSKMMAKMDIFGEVQEEKTKLKKSPRNEEDGAGQADGSA